MPTNHLQGIQAVTFDLDGTLCPQRPSSISPFERVLLPGVKTACRKISNAGLKMGIATNQGGLGKGLSLDALLTHLAWLETELGIAWSEFAVDGFFKKPNPGMLLQLMLVFEVAPASVLFVGDSETDRLAAENAGCKFAWAGEFFDLLNGRSK